MKNALLAIAFAYLVGCSTAPTTVTPTADKLDLKDGATLYLHPDGTSRMVDVHGKKIEMRDGVEMQLADGRMIMMKNNKVWVSYGPRGAPYLKND
jgi:hypothetical protein